MNLALRFAMLLTRYRDWAPFLTDTNSPELAQRAVLQKILARHAATRFGAFHRFASIRTYEEFVRAVPICTYEDLRTAIELQEQTGEPMLTQEQPICYAQTSGTTGEPKHIPLLQDTVDSMRRYQRLFTYAQCHALPTMYEGKVLVISGATVEGHLPGGTPFGSMSGLLYDCLPAAIRRKSLFPDGPPADPDYRQRYLTIAATALADPSLSVLATPNPSTILKVLEVIRSEYETLLAVLSGQLEIAPGTSRLASTVSPSRLSWLRALVGESARLDYATLWPKLQAVVTWTAGNCAVLMPRLRSLLPPQAHVIEMGYLSSECLGTLTVDVLNNRCVPTLHDNLFEFVEVGDDVSDGRPVLLHELQEGRKYAVIVTTTSGLYRYAMNDIVEVTGSFNRTPTVRFVQKGKGVTSITGEKLYEHQVVEAVEQVLTAQGKMVGFFVMLADVAESRYTLCIEGVGAVEEMASLLDARLADINIEFKAKRESGRLQPTHILQLRPGAGDAFRQHCVSRGQREAQFKLLRLQYVHECTFDFTTYGSASRDQDT